MSSRGLKDIPVGFSDVSGLVSLQHTKPAELSHPLVGQLNWFGVLG